MKFTLTQSLIATVGMGNAIRNFLKCNVRVVYIFCCLLDNKNIKTNKEDMMKKIVTLGILMICLLVAVRMTTFANAESIEEVSFVDADDVVDEKNVERGDSGIIEDNYLIQHSAGSGKSNSIAWTAYRMASLHNENNDAIFNSVIIITDRRILDQQLQATVSSFDHTLGSVVTIDEKKNSGALRDAINDGKRIISQITRMFDKELHKEYVFCSYLAKLLPSDPVQPFDLDNRVKLEYYRLEKTYEGAIELESKPGSWKPTQPKRAGGQKDRTSPLDEIIQRINEEFYGEFTDADRVMVDTLYQKMRKDSKAKKAAKTEDRQVYERSLFPGIFDTTAQEAYMENTAAYEQLFLDADKYQAVMRALADRLYKELHDDK